MRNLFITLVFLISTLVVAPTSFGNDSEFKLKGKLFSASATIPPGGNSALLTEVPEGKDLTVTQYCTNTFMGTLELVGSELGLVPAAGQCTTYVPGVLFEGGQSVSCRSLFPPPPPGPFQPALVCLINGVIR